MLTIEIESDGVNPPIYRVPEGATLVFTDWGDSGHTVTLVGPYEGNLEDGDDGTS